MVKGSVGLNHLVVFCEINSKVLKIRTHEPADRDMSEKLVSISDKGCFLHIFECFVIACAVIPRFHCFHKKIL